MPLALLTPGDLTRISAETGLAADLFSVTRTMDREERAGLEVEDPMLRGLVGEDGRASSLAKRGGACVCHSRREGCSLPYEARPVLCRRFPLVRVDGRLHVRPGGDCLAVEEAPTLPALLVSLRTSVREMNRVDAQIRRDLAAPSPPDPSS
jgi:Fe-S-cluster containining protein